MARGLLTHTVQEQLALGREAVVDDIVQQGDVQAPGGQVRDDERGALAVRELGQVDFTGRLVQGTVDVGAAHALGRQQLFRWSEDGGVVRSLGPGPGDPNPTGFSRPTGKSSGKGDAVCHGSLRSIRLVAGA